MERSPPGQRVEENQTPAQLNDSPTNSELFVDRVFLWDSNADVSSPQHIESSVIDLLEIDSAEQSLSLSSLRRRRTRSVSVIANRLSRKNPLDITPERRPLPDPIRVSVSEEDFREVFIDQLENLRSARSSPVSLSREPSLQSTESPPNSSEDLDPVIGQTPELIDSRMNEDEYRETSGSLGRELRAARRAIGGYTFEDVRIIEKDSFLATLREIKRAVNDVVDQLDEFTDKLKDPADIERKRIWDNEIKSLLQEEKNNANLVKDKMQELVEASEAAKAAAAPVPPAGGNSAIEELLKVEREKILAALNREKAQILQKQEIVKKEADNISTKLLEVSVDKDTPDDEIRSLTLKTEKWKQELKSLEKRVGELLIESAGLDDAVVKENNQKIETLVSKASKAVDVSCKEVMNEHDKRGFYMLTDNKSKETVEFPSFHGKRGENVYEFVSKFKRAIVANQVAERDKVPKLTKCLAGSEAKDWTSFYRH